MGEKERKLALAKRKPERFATGKGLQGLPPWERRGEAKKGKKGGARRAYDKNQQIIARRITD